MEVRQDGDLVGVRIVEEVVTDGELNGLVLSFRYSVALRVVGGCYKELST